MTEAELDRAWGDSPLVVADELARELVVRYLHELKLGNRVVLANDRAAAMGELGVAP